MVVKQETCMSVTHVCHVGFLLCVHFMSHIHSDINYYYPCTQKSSYCPNSMDQRDTLTLLNFYHIFISLLSFWDKKKYKTFTQSPIIHTFSNFFYNKNDKMKFIESFCDVNLDVLNDFHLFLKLFAVKFLVLTYK